MRRKARVATVVFVCLLGGWAEAGPKTKAQPKAPPVKAAATKADKDHAKAETVRVETLLKEGKIEELRFNQHEVRDAIEFFREAFKINVHVEWKALEAAGLSKTTPITLDLRDVTFERALKVVLAELSGSVAGADAELLYAVDEGVLVISTRAALARMPITRVYPAADLLCLTRRSYTGSSGYPWRNTSFLPIEPEPMEESHAAAGIFEDDSGLDRGGYAGGTEEAAENLIQLLTTIVDRDSWGDPDGGGAGMGMIQVVGTSLVVTQTHENHMAVEKLLAMLREDREGRKVRIGFAVVRFTQPDTDKALREALAKAKDPSEALIDGADKGSWTLDRCKLEKTVLGDVIRATDTFTRTVKSVPEYKGKAAVILPHTTLYGYEVGVLPKTREDDELTVSVACGGGWITKEQDPSKDTPEKTTGTHARHNVFDFTLQPGESRVFTAVPPEAKDGGVKVVVWLPKQAK